MTDDRLTSDELFAIFNGLIPTPVAFYLMNGGAKLDRGALEMVQAVREQATNDRIEAQAAEIDRLAAENELLKKEVERRSYDGIHTCHDDCQRVACRQRREIAQLISVVDALLQHDTSTFWGPDSDKNKRASYRGVIRKAKKVRIALGDAI
jgi:hypothetical protein